MQSSNAGKDTYMPNRNKQLGTGLENRVVERARNHGLVARKQPLSGALKDFPSDVVIENILGECKVRTASIDAKGQRYVKLDLDWKAKVDDQALDSGFEAAVLVVNAKGSSTPQVVVGLDFFLKLVRQRKDGDALHALVDYATENYIDNPPSIYEQRQVRRRE
jgi:hypothetical protein